MGDLNGLAAREAGLANKTRQQPRATKPVVQSRLVWLLVTIATVALTRWLGHYLPPELAQLVAQMLSDEVLAVLVPVLAGAGIVLKVEDKRQAERLAQAMLAERDKPLRSPFGFATMGLLAGLAMMAAAAVLLTGCGTTWPAQCQTSLSAITCRCQKVRFAVDRHPTKPAPSGVVRTSCDGKLLPVEVEGGHFDTAGAPHDP